MFSEVKLTERILNGASPKRNSISTRAARSGRASIVAVWATKLGLDCTFNFNSNFLE